VDAGLSSCNAYASARPGSDRAHLCIGSAYLLKHKPREALAYLRPYADARPSYARARRTLLAALFASGEIDEAQSRLARWEAEFAGSSELIEARAALQGRSR
jgi:hypothetical protein